MQNGEHIPPSPAADPQGEGPEAMGELFTRVWIRSAVLSAILFLMIMYTLYLAATLLAPIAVAFLLSIVLSPLVRFLVGLRVPQTLSALLVMLGLVAAVTTCIYAVAEPAISWMQRAPSELQQLEYKLSWVKEPIADLQEAREQVDAITRVGDAAEPPPPRDAPSFSLVESLLRGAPDVVFGLAVMLILLFFVLASGDALLNKAVQVTPALKDKKRVVETGRGVQRHVSRYLGTVTIINAGVGVAVGTAMFLLNMPNPILWGVMMGVLNFIPYVGVLVSMTVVAFVGLLTFDTTLEILAPPAAIFAINLVEGQFLTPILTGRRLSLSPVAVFLSLVVMGWIWGVLGVLIAVPLLATAKLVCEEIETLTPIATFLSDT